MLKHVADQAASVVREMGSILMESFVKSDEVVVQLKSNVSLSTDPP